MATIIGELFCEEKTNSILSAEFETDKDLIIADFDGTIFHKHDELKTLNSIDVFNSYSCRVICTSRSLHDIKLRVNELSITPDYIISWSGALITNSKYEVLHLNEMCFTSEEGSLSNLVPIKFNEKVIQYYSDDLTIMNKLPISVRAEQYENGLFVSSWNCTKLNAIQKLLNLIQWNGKVKCFGDSKYDFEFLNFYDGYLIQEGNNITALKSSNCIF